MPDRGSNSRDSSSREKLIEHLFIGELLRSLWQLKLRGVEILRAETDAAGYDLVIECRGILRHIQLKSSGLGAKTAVQKINKKLELKPSGCVVWVRFDTDTLELKHFLWFGDAPGLPLPALGDKVARHSKGDSKGHKAERPGIRNLARNRFTELNTMAEVARRLFGVG